MKTQVAAHFQVSAYSEKVANEIAERIRNTIRDNELGKPSNPIIEESMGINEGWPQEPEVYIFFDMEEEDEVDNNGIPVKVLKAIAGENIQLWQQSNLLLDAKPPETVQQHAEWTGLSINEYQHIYISRKLHPHAERYKCNASTCQEWDAWYSLPGSFELARPECPSCNKLGQRIP